MNLSWKNLSTFFIVKIQANFAVILINDGASVKEEKVCEG
jgi:hypothetical protein